MNNIRGLFFYTINTRNSGVKNRWFYGRSGVIRLEINDLRLKMRRSCWHNSACITTCARNCETVIKKHKNQVTRALFTTKLHALACTVDFSSRGEIPSVVAHSKGYIVKDFRMFAGFLFVTVRF